ncbi:MAG TPA: beta-ketoacyl-ACP synthase III [Oscillospiraceae bacterium]|nr:ketoacyl-ACP synthase III [Oscillospiraceae bacterium]HPV99925.1 beta-ketoacyl-ACP synthase III [Oscillospiraceae bacterium]
MSLKIIGTGRALPQKAVSNDDLSAFLDTNDEWISSRTGVKSRYLCGGESLTDLCESAARKAIQKSGLELSEIDLVLCSTLGGDYITPSLSCSVAERLGISCPAFDLNAACSGFLYAMDVASVYLESGRANHILILCAEMMSKYVDWNDRATCVLFGDGAGACVVAKGTALKYIHLTAEGDTKILFCETGGGNSPYQEKKERGFVHMQGQEVFKFAVRMIETETKAALESLSYAAGDIDYYLLHQANRRIIDFAREKLGQPEEKFPTNIHKYGNISSASIPVLLDELLEAQKIQKGAKLLMSAFGAGLTAGTCVMIWE